MSLKLFDFETNNVGLGTYTHTCASTALYSVNVQLSVIPASSAVIVIKLNSSTLATSPAPSATQNHIELSAANINCTATDVLSVVITSAATADALPQALKGTVQIGKVNTP